MLRLVTFLFLVTTALADTLPQRIESYLQPRLHSPASSRVDATKLAAILARPDPGTFFLRYAFGLKQQAKQLFNAKRAKRLFLVIDTHIHAGMMSATGCRQRCQSAETPRRPAMRFKPNCPTQASWTRKSAVCSKKR